MICNQTVEKYCSGDISQIENYDKAINDKTHGIAITDLRFRIMGQLFLQKN